MHQPNKTSQDGKEELKEELWEENESNNAILEFLFNLEFFYY